MLRWAYQLIPPLFVLFQDKKPDWALQKDGRSKSMASVNDVPRSSESETVGFCMINTQSSW